MGKTTVMSNDVILRFDKQCATVIINEKCNFCLLIVNDTEQ